MFMILNIKDNNSILNQVIFLKLQYMIASCVYPSKWCEALIVPIHKSGSVSDMNNYRGISLLSCISKIFSKILNDRLRTWADENDKDVL